MVKNDDVCFTSSSIRVPHFSRPAPFLSPVPFFSPQCHPLSFSRARDSLSRLITSLKSFKKSTYFHSKSSLLCSASLALTRSSDESAQSTLEGAASQKGQLTSRHGREAEERVLISEVLVRSKDGEELERKDLEQEAFAALKACRPNSALTVREVQEDVQRIIDSGYFSSCMPVAVDTRDGIRLVFQVYFLSNNFLLS